MKTLGLLAILIFLASSISADDLMPIPANCAKEISLHGYCSKSYAPIFKGPVNISFFIIVDKAVFPSVEKLYYRYISFDSWGDFADSSGKGTVKFRTTTSLAPIESENHETIHRHYFDYKLSTPIGWRDVRGLSHNKKIKPRPGAVFSMEFKVQNKGPQEVPAGAEPLNGAEGLKAQTGYIHILECSGQTICEQNQWLIIYESTITPSMDIFPKIAARSIKGGIEAILLGMLAGDREKSIIH
jgi:hypothetical protein